MKIIAYARMSPRRYADESESIETQFQVIEDYCERHGWEIIERIEDRERSGADADRPGLHEALFLLKPGMALVAHRLDRIARDSYLSEWVYRQVKKARCSLIVADGSPIDNTPTGQLLRRMMDAFNEFDRSMIALRTSTAMAIKQRNGQRMSSKPPLGFMLDPDNEGMLKENPEEQRALRRILQLDERGLSPRKIATTLTKEGYQPRGTKWFHTTVMNAIARYRGNETRLQSRLP